MLANTHRQNQGQQGQGRTRAPSWELEAALNDLFNRPNLDIAADVATVQPVFAVDLATTGTVIHEGYTSILTAGPKTGFGLIPLDGGIGFYNSQSMFFVTLIHDFQQRLAQDPQGQKATQLYDFTAATYDWSNLTVARTTTPDGLGLAPNLTHNIDAAICSAPTQGNGLKRGIAALIGMDQDRITEKVKEGALPRFRQEIPQEALEEALERSSVEQAKQNADPRSKYLPGNDTAQVGDFLIKQLSMASRPEAIYLGGRFEWRGAPHQRGADMPRPPRLASTIEPGVAVDPHLGSLLTSAAGGIWQQDRFRSVRNMMIRTKAVPPGTPPEDAVEVRENVRFADYIKAVDAARNAHDPRVQALRITRPQQPPEFSTDARGYLVALVRDFQLDAPAPDRQSGGAMLGVPAKVLRFRAPLVEVALSYRPDRSTPGSLQLKGKIQEFNLGTRGEVLAIDDENQAKPLNRFRSAIAMTALGARMRSQNIDVNLDRLQVPGFAIRSVSPLDPSGWARINLVRTGGTPLRQTQPAPDVRPGPTHGPTVPGSTTPSPTGAPAATPTAGPDDRAPPGAGRGAGGSGGPHALSGVRSRLDKHSTLEYNPGRDQLSDPNPRNFGAWTIRPRDDYERRKKRYEKKHPRELAAVLDNLDTYFRALAGGTRPKQALASFGFVHAEPSDVVAVTEKGQGPALAATRLYAYPDATRETLYLITLGDKKSQRDDIAVCKDFVAKLPELEGDSNDEEEVHQRRPDGPRDD